MAPDGGNVDHAYAFPDGEAVILMLSSTVDGGQPIDGTGGLEIFDGESWVLAADWSALEAGSVEVDFIGFGGTIPAVGMPWRLTSGFGLTAGGEQLQPRSGILEVYPEQLMAARAQNDPLSDAKKPLRD